MLDDDVDVLRRRLGRVLSRLEEALEEPREVLLGQLLELEADRARKGAHDLHGGPLVAGGRPLGELTEPHAVAEAQRGQRAHLAAELDLDAGVRIEGRQRVPARDRHR